MEDELNQLIEIFVANGCNISDTIRYANLINERYIVDETSVDLVKTFFLEDSNPQIRRLGLMALSNHAPNQAKLLRETFEQFLRDNYIWCVYDALRGLSKLVCYLNQTCIDKISEIVKTCEHDKTKETALKLVTAIHKFKTPNLKKVEINNKRLCISLPEDWAEVMDPLNNVIPYAYQLANFNRIQFKCAIVKKPDTIHHVQELVETNVKQYSKIWTIHKQWTPEIKNAEALLLAQDFTGGLSNQATDYIVKLFLIDEQTIYYLSYYYPFGSEFLCEELILNLANKVEWIN